MRILVFFSRTGVDGLEAAYAFIQLLCNPPDTGLPMPYHDSTRACDVECGVVPFVDGYIPRQQRLHSSDDGIMIVTAIHHVVDMEQAHVAHAYRRARPRFR